MRSGLRQPTAIAAQPPRSDPVGHSANHHECAGRNVLRRCAERCGVDRNQSPAHRNPRLGPGGKEERELGWLDWSVLDDITPDGREILFDEAGAGGGVNYTAFVRGSDGSAPVRIGEGSGLGISADGKWVIMQAAKGGPLRVVPTGAGEARQLTHDNVSYQRARWLAGGKELLASGFESGHGARDYLIAVSSGDAKPITPEGWSA